MSHGASPKGKVERGRMMEEECQVVGAMMQRTRPTLMVLVLVLVMAVEITINLVLLLMNPFILMVVTSFHLIGR